MAIRHRRGNYTNFDPSKMVAGEIAVVQSGDPNTGSGKSMYIAPTAGAVKRVAFIDDIEQEVYNITDDIAAEFNGEVADSVTRAETAATNAEASATSAAQHVTRFADANLDGNIVITIGGV